MTAPTTDPAPDPEVRTLLDAERRQGVRQTPPPASELMARIEADDRGLGGLRSLSTTSRFALAGVVAAVIVLAIALLLPRDDMGQYPASRMIVSLLALAGVGAGALVLMMRGVARERAPWPVFATVVAAALAAPVLMGTMPEPGGVHAEGPEHFMRAAAGCGLFGFVVVIPWLVIATRLVRVAPPTYSQSWLMSGFAGVLAAMVLQLHCEVGDGLHIMVGHGLVGLVYAVLFFIAYSALGRVGRSA